MNLLCFLCCVSCLFVFIFVLSVSVNFPFLNADSSFYNVYLENFEFEHYLDILPDKDRITYCRFRTGNHTLRLPIETGRWHRIERQNRYCNLCQYQELGDEFHYILQCRSLVDIRKKF